MRSCFDASSSSRRRRSSPIVRPVGILERRQQIEERRSRIAPKLLLERVGVEALRVVRDRVEVRAVALRDHERPVVRRPLDEHATLAGIPSDDEVERLERPVRQQDLAGRNAVQLRKPLAQRLVAPDRPVVECPSAVALEDLPRAVGELGRRKQLRRRHSRGRARSSALHERAGDFGDELRDLGRRRADGIPHRLEGGLLRLRRARRCPR